MRGDDKLRSDKTAGWLTNSLLRPAAHFLVAAFLMWLLYGLLGAQGHLLYMWPITGIQIAILLSGPQGRIQRWSQIIAGAVGMSLASFALGNPPWRALAQPAMHAAELWALWWTMSKGICRFDDLKNQANVIRFCSSAILVPVFAALLIAQPLATMAHASVFQAWTRVVLSDSLGIAIFTPMVLLALSGQFAKREHRTLYFQGGIPALLFFAAAVVLIFSQDKYPLMFLVFPPLLIFVFAAGLEGGVCASAVASIIACLATAHGIGPIWGIPDTTHEHHVLILQLFLWVIVATALPIGSLLDAREEAEREASKSQTIYQTVMDNSLDMIVLSGLNGKFLFVSPAVEKVTGWTQQEFLALPRFGSIHSEDHDLAENVIASIASGKVDHTFRYRLTHKNGGLSWVEGFMRGYRDSPSGPVAGFVLTLHDIRTQKETEDGWSAEVAALADKNAHLATLAAMDALTAIPNRRTFDQVLPVEARRHSSSGECLSLLMLDVDSFKKYNDRYGHPAGDVCLRKVARVIQESTGRASDLAARIGGEEFAVILPQSDEQGAIYVAYKILQAVRDLNIPHEDSVTGKVSVSIGVAVWLPFETNEVSLLIQQADRALYESKSGGRNRVTVHIPGPGTQNVPGRRNTDKQHGVAQGIA
jgi:diguanylate cyclase (GGDEF)-like protein/PAS domain S-box-containing protein